MFEEENSLTAPYLDDSAQSYMAENQDSMPNILPGFIFWVLLVPVGAFAGIMFLEGAKLLAAGILGGYILCSMLVSPQIAIYIFFAWQAWDGVLLRRFQMGGFTVGKALAFIVLFSYILHMSRTKSLVGKDKGVILFSMLFVLFGLLTSPLAINVFVAVKSCLQMIVLVLIMIAALKVIDTPKRLSTAVFWLVAGGAGAAIGLIAGIGGGGSLRYTRGTLSQDINPSTVAAALSISVSAIPALWVLVRSKLNHAFCIICAVLLLAGIMKTGSRAPIAGLALAFTIGGFMVKGREWGKKILIAILALSLGAGIFLLVLKSGILDEKSQKRLEAFVGIREESDATGRMDLWKLSIEAWLDINPIIGVGVANTEYAQQQYSGIFKPVHNTLLAPLLELGIIGMAFFYAMLWEWFQRIRQVRITSIGVPAAIMFINMLAFSGTHTMHYTKYFWIPIMLSLLIVKYERMVNFTPDVQYSEEIDCANMPQSHSQDYVAV